MDAAFLEPADEAEAAAMVAEARAAKRTLAVVGGGTRAGLADPARAGATLSTRRLSGIVFYEPAEMTIRVRAGTPLRVVEETLAQRGQRLAFEPHDARALYGTSGEPTIGGAVAVNASGPRRIAAGALRDACLGLRLVNGMGETIAAGGRVTKNVTGLDLTKFVCGSRGALGLVTEATFKVAPIPEAEAMLVIRHLEAPRAVEAMSQALGSPFGVTGAAWFPAGMGRSWPRVFLRIEGFEDSVKYRVERLVARLAEFGARGALWGEQSAKLWRAARDVATLAEPRDRAVWRVTLRPSRAPALLKSLGGLTADAFLDWGGGLVWFSTPPNADVAGRVRASVAAQGGALALVRAPDALRASLGALSPPGVTLARLTQGARESFDPDGVFDAGRAL